jgi:hypothetical protein
MLRFFFTILVCSVGIAHAQQPAAAPDATLKLSAEDQKNFKEVCAMAMRNAALPTETTYGVSAWCVNMNAKIVQAATPPAKPEEGK